MSQNRLNTIENLSPIMGLYAFAKINSEDKVLTIFV